MDTEKALREVLANLRLVADSLRARGGVERNLAPHIDAIAARIQALQLGDVADENPAELIADTLELVETFRGIKSPEVRKAVVRMICALRSD